MKRGRSKRVKPHSKPSKRPMTPMGERETALPSQVQGGISFHSGPESNVPHPSGQLYPRSSSRFTHGGREQQHMPSIFVDRGPLAVTEGGPIGQYLSGIFLAECSSKEPGSAGPGEAFSSPRVGLSPEAEPSARDHEVEGIYSPGPRSSQLGTSSVPQGGPSGSGTSYLQGAHNFTIGTLNMPSITANLNVLRGKIREWLKAPSYHGIHTFAIDQRTDGTGMWFINSNEFQQLKRGGGCVLWCTGMPGSGKTVLASISIEHLEDSFKSETNVAVLYAYLRYSEKHTLRDVFAALLDQLLEHDVVVTTIEPSYSEKARKGATCTSEKVAWHILKDAIRSLFEVFLVIDGVDEADDEVKDGLLGALPSIGINILILSRPLELFTHHTPNALQVSIQARTEDIALCVDEQFRKNSRLRDLLDGRPELATKLSTRIKKQANGMFLLARLQLENVMRTSRSTKTLFEALENLPSGVDEMYNLTLQRINDQDEEGRLAAHRLLTWILHRDADSELDIQDLRHALAVSIEDQAYDERAIISVNLLLSACHGLVVTSAPHLFWLSGGSKPTFRLIHYSTQEFLRKVSFATIPYPRAFLAATCLVFAAHHATVIQSGVPQGRIFPFLEYACTEWGEHARSSQHLGEPLHPSIVPSLLRCSMFPFLMDWRAESVTPILHQIASQKVGFGTEIVMLPSLTVACMYGLVDVVKSGSLPVSMTSTASFGPYLGFGHTVATPFHSATTFGHFNTFVALLSTYGTQRIPLWTSKDQFLPPLLHFVVVSPRSGVPFLQKLFDIIDNPPDARVRLALSEFDVNFRDDRGNTALILACENAGEDMIHLLISRQGVEVGLRNARGYDAFHKSASRPESGVALLLLEHFPTLDVKTADKYGRTALMTACRHGHQQLIDYIRTRRPDEWERLMHRTDMKGRTALMELFETRSVWGPATGALMRTLIESGSDLHARESEEGMTPFLYAIRYHRSGAAKVAPLITHVLKPLLAYDPSVIYQCDDRGRTALMLELRKFTPDHKLVQFLIFSHPIPEQYFNLRDADDLSALMHAIGKPSLSTAYPNRSARVQAVKFLLNQPSLDMNQLDQMGRGILEIACSATWLFRPGLVSGNRNPLFPILDAILRAKNRWDVSMVRKAVIAGIRKMHPMAVYRLLLEDWVVHSFAWSLDDTDTVTLLAQVWTSSWTCQAPVSIVLRLLGLLDSPLLAGGIDKSNYRGLAETFCGFRGHGRNGCKWHSDWGEKKGLPALFSDRRSYSTDELGRMIPIVGKSRTRDGSWPNGLQWFRVLKPLEQR